MRVINTISGGKTSAYIAANYKSDYNVFALVRVQDQQCLFPDKKIRQLVEDKIQKPFIGTVEDDTIIYTILDLEQFIGKKIEWVSGITFDKVVKTKGGWLPNKLHRYCTTHLKMQPLFEWWQKNINKPSEFRLGFRANEQSRAKNTLAKTNKNGLLEMKAIIGKRGSRNKWGLIEWQKPVFPLINDNIYKDQIENYWKDKPVRFAWMNNCVGCFHKNELLLKKMYELHPNKMNWFEKQELNRNPRDGWKNHKRYKDIKNINLQFELFESDFSECDSGYCGI
tara:strand:+ start:268 stop:1110 length:843 start_codon:yes stop_codon:yes gene_type:complete